MRKIGLFDIPSAFWLATEFWARGLKDFLVDILIGGVVDEIWKAPEWHI
jgi:hypothetical protein